MESQQTRPAVWQCPGHFTQNMDDVYHPKHYTEHPTGVECIEIAEAFNFNLGNAIKYIWRAGLKTPDPIKDLEKAQWYIRREINRLYKARGE